MISLLANAFRVLSDGLHSVKWYWVLWVYLMVIVNGILPLFFLPQFSAIIVLVSAFTGLAIGLVLTHALGFSKILGLMHFPWIPMVCFQIYYFSLQNFALNNIHDYWLLTSLTISSISLMIDVKDVHGFLKN